MTEKLYYCVHVSNSAPRHRGSALMWSRALDTIGEARRRAQALVDDGEATLAVVVVFEGGEKQALKTWVWPVSARRIIGHWEDILDALEEP